MARIVRKRRRRSRTSAEIAHKAKAKKTLEPTEMGDTESENMTGEKWVDERQRQINRLS